MRKPGLSWWLPLAVTWVGAQHAAPLHAQGVAPRIEVVPHEDLRRVDVQVDGKPFTSYIWLTTLKKPTLYPLRAASGAVVTRGWPLEPRPGERVDHPHQVGLWFDHVERALAPAALGAPHRAMEDGAHLVGPLD